MSLLENLLNNSNNINIENDVGILQKFFLESNIGQVVNGGLNSGIKALLPDSLEDDVIEVKDAIVEGGFSEGVKVAIDKAVELGQNALGIVTGKFTTIDEIKEALNAGGLSEKISSVLDFAINKVEKYGLLSSDKCNMIRTGKNIILNTINTSVDNELTGQIKAFKGLEENINKWTESYNKQDFQSMEKYYNKIEEDLYEIAPLEETIIKTQQLENIHNLIKNNGKNFSLSNEELELANKLF